MSLEVPPSDLAAVCSHEQWDEIYGRLTQLIEQHRSTLIFVNTRRLAERIAHRLTEQLGEEAVASHHGSLSKRLRQSAEQRLKAGQLRAIVATASLELGIDIGYIDLVCQIGSPRSIATFLQRVGRSGHSLGTGSPWSTVSADARRADRMPGAGPLRPPGRTGPHRDPGGAVGYPGSTDDCRSSQSGLGRAGVVRVVPPGLAVSRFVHGRFRRRGPTHHGRCGPEFETGARTCIATQFTVGCERGAELALPPRLLGVPFRKRPNTGS